MRFFPFVLLLSFLSLAGRVQAQQTAVYTEAHRQFKAALTFYEDGLLAKAQRSFDQVIDQLTPINDQEATLLRTRAELLRAKCALLLEAPDGEKATMDYIRARKPDPEYDEALIDIANFYFDQRKYDQALDYLAEVPTTGMSSKELQEVRFKQGYAHFVRKEFTVAKSFFRDISRDNQSDYYAQTQYYLGLCYFFEGDYDNSVECLQKVANDEDYRRHIPYYITQIYFAQRRFDELIAYAEPLIYDTRLRNQREINQLLGQAYFENGDYQKALPFLEKYAESASSMREEELYQLGFAQYQTGNYRKAVTSLKPLTAADSPISQNAMYYLADCYLRLGDKQNALTSLASAKRQSYDPQIQEEALFTHAKLAYELNLPQEAINDLRSIQPTSRYYPESQELLSEIFLNYRDYRQALVILDDIRQTSNNPRILETYQTVALNRGIQLLLENDLDGAVKHLNLSLETPVNARNTAVAGYWLGEIAHRRENFQESIRLIDKFLIQSSSAGQLPEESSVFSATYLQGYNYLKLDNYQKARTYFEQTVDGITRNRRFLANEEVTNKVLGDATMRLGDAYFKFNQYESALRYYNDAINERYAGYDYAIFQKAIIEGLRGRKTEEIIALEELTNSFPNSAWADDALLRLGTSYQEIGKLSQAEAPLRKLITDYRRRSDLINQALIKLGLISYNLGNLQGAANYYKQIFGNNPEPNEAQIALRGLEEIYIRDLGRPEDYFAFLETIPGYKPDNFVRDSITFKAAETRFENADYARAIESYTDYIRQFPQGFNLLTAYYHRGESYSVLRQYSEALDDYEFVVNQGPSKYYLKALEKAAIIAYNHELDFERSFELYASLERAATDADMLFEAQLGGLRSAYRIGNTSALYNLANKVAGNSKASPDQVATANFYLGKIAFDNQDYDNALPSLQRVVSLSDNEQTAEARYLIAYIYYQKRDLNRAQELCLQANQESSAYPYWVAKSVLLLADILAEKGDLYNARAALEALLENYDEDVQLVQQAQTRLGQINRQIEQSSILERSNQGNNQ